VRTVVHLLRHGEVENPEGVLYGRLPGFHLSDRGRRQAAAAAADLARGPAVTAVVSSPMERARETAQAVADATGAAVSIDERLIESENIFEGRSTSFRLAYLAPHYLRHYRNPLRPSWGEPFRDVAARVRAAVDDARRAHPGGQVVCVSHQSPIWVTRRALEGRPLVHNPRRRECALASLTTLTYDGDALVGVGYREPAAAL
jgi:broad specificity phosphatase PhoE